MKKILTSDYNFDTIHIIGNGPSAARFDCTPGLVISIHVPKISSDIVFSQRPIFWGNFGIPIAMRYNLGTTDEQAKILWKDKDNISKIDKHFVIKDWMLYVLGEPLINTGHCAYLWAMHHNPSKVYLWGFDNIFSKSYEYKPSYREDHEYRVQSGVSKESFIEKTTGQKIWKNYWSKILQPNTQVCL